MDNYGRILSFDEFDQIRDQLGRIERHRVVLIHFTRVIYPALPNPKSMGIHSW